MCRQNYCIISHKSIHRSSGCSKNISYNEEQIFHSKFDALFKIFHKRMSYMPTIPDAINCQQGSYRPQIYLNYRPMSKLSMDLKVMPRSQKGHKFILCIIDEMMNYLITSTYIPFKVRRSRRSTYRACNIKILCS